MFSVEEAIALLKSAQVIIDNEEDPSEPKPAGVRFEVWQNDVWGWALSFAESVTEEELPALARLVYLYGDCGAMYWVSQKNEGMRSEFHDNNRKIDFVGNEERIVKEVPDYNQRAYHKESYSLGTS